MTGGSEGVGGRWRGGGVRAAALFGSKSTDVQWARCSSGRKQSETERLQRAAEESLASVGHCSLFFFSFFVRTSIRP